MKKKTSTNNDNQQIRNLILETLVPALQVDSSLPQKTVKLSGTTSTMCTFLQVKINKTVS